MWLLESQALLISNFEESKMHNIRREEEQDAGEMDVIAPQHREED